MAFENGHPGEELYQQPYTFPSWLLALEGRENLDLHLDLYSTQIFSGLIDVLANTNALRHLRVVRSQSIVHRRRSNEEVQAFLQAVLGRPNHSSNNSSIRLKSLALEHLNPEDIQGLPALLANHPSLEEVGINLTPCNQSQIPFALAKALASMPKLRSLRLEVSSGQVLISEGECFAGDRDKLSFYGSRKPYFPSLSVLEVSLPREQEVNILTQQLASSSTFLTLRELHLTTHARVGSVVDSIAGMIASTETLEELYLSFQSQLLDDCGCILLGDALALNQSLLYLELGPWLDSKTATMIGRNPEEAISRRGGCRALIAALKQHTKLESLTFDGDWPGDVDEQSSNISVSSDTEHLTDDEGDEPGVEARDSLDAREEDTQVSFHEEAHETREEWYDADTGMPDIDEEWWNTLETHSYGEDDGYSATASKEAVAQHSITPQDVEDSIPFALAIDFYLKLNRAGRGDLLRSDVTKAQWMDVLASQKHDPSRIYYFLRSNPSLFRNE